MLANGCKLNSDNAQLKKCISLYFPSLYYLIVHIIVRQVGFRGKGCFFLGKGLWFYWPMVLKMSNWPLWQKGTQKKSSKSKKLFRLLIFKSQTLKHFQYFSYCILYTSIDIMLRGTLSQLHKGFHLGVNLRTQFSHFCCLTVLVWHKSKVLRGHSQSHTVLYTHKSPW